MNFPHIPPQYTAQKQNEGPASGESSASSLMARGASFFIVLLAVVAVIAALVTFWPAQKALAPQEDVPGSHTEEQSGTATSLTHNASPTAPAAPVQTSQAGTRFLQNGIYVTVVEYTSAGFVPFELEIKAGEEVRFVNRDNLTMRVVTDEKKSNQYYASVKQPDSVGKGGTFQLGFSQPGLFTYYNLNSNPRNGGTIRVK